MLCVRSSAMHTVQEFESCQSKKSWLLCSAKHTHRNKTQTALSFFNSWQTLSSEFWVTWVLYLQHHQPNKRCHSAWPIYGGGRSLGRDSLSSHMQIWVEGWKAQWPLGKARSKDRQEIGSGLNPTLPHKSQGAEPAQRTHPDSYRDSACQGKEQGNSQRGLAGVLEMLSTPLCCSLRTWSGTELPGHGFQRWHGDNGIPRKSRCWFCLVNNLLAMTEEMHATS